MIKVKEAEVCLSETTVRELLRAIEEAKKTIVFSGEMKPMPDGDMSTYQYELEQRKRGNIIVSSPHGDIKFRVEVETLPNTQESLGYKLEKPKELEESNWSDVSIY
jgi:hypothetical protein